MCMSGCGVIRLIDHRTFNRHTALITLDKPCSLDRQFFSSTPDRWTILNMGSVRWLSGKILSQCLIICLIVCPIYTDMCQPLGSGQSDPDPVQRNGKYDQDVTLEGEADKAPYYYARWIKTVINPDTQQPTYKNMVTHNANGEDWHAPSERMSAIFVEESPTGTMKYRLQILKLLCDDARMYTCTFNLQDGSTCDVRFNLTITADPLPPLIQNDTIRVDAGTTVTIVCEANVGLPAGDIAWYYVEPGQSIPLSRIVDGVNNTEKSAEDCRRYVTSTLTVQVNREDQDAKFRCVTLKYAGGTQTHFHEVRVAINGLEPTTTPAGPPCKGDECNSVGGGVANVVISMSAIIAQALLLLIAICMV